MCKSTRGRKSAHAGRNKEKKRTPRRQRSEQQQSLVAHDWRRGLHSRVSMAVAEAKATKAKTATTVDLKNCMMRMV